MRLGVVLAAVPGSPPLASLAAQAAQAEASGLELGWLESLEEPPLISAAALSPLTSVLRLAVCEPANRHPLEIAEAAAIADNLSNGRLILVLEDVSGDADLLRETVDVVLAATASRPFRHRGERWQIPANLPENDLPEERIMMTPTTAQFELPVWLAGRCGPIVSRERGLSHVSTSVAAAGAEWAAAETALGAAAARLRRPAIFDLDADGSGAFDLDALVDRLRDAQLAWGLDVAVLRLPAELGLDARETAIRRFATHVRPRVTMHQLPLGLDAHWREALP